MAHYSLYIPNVQGANNEHLTKLGLQSLCNDVGPEWCDVLQNGPDGGRGMVATWRLGSPDIDPSFGVNLSKQTWVQAPPREAIKRKKGDFWIGWETERPPRPGDLVRKKMYPGRHITLHDGFPWIVPETIHLPHIVGLDDNGELAMCYAPEFQEFCKRAEKYAGVICKQMGVLERLRMARPNVPAEQVAVDFTLQDSFTFCCDALALNYRVNPEIISALQLLAKTHIVAVLAATISLPDILEVTEEKKTALEPVSIPVG